MYLDIKPQLRLRPIDAVSGYQSVFKVIRSGFGFTFLDRLSSKNIFPSEQAVVAEPRRATVPKLFENREPVFEWKIILNRTVKIDLHECLIQPHSTFHVSWKYKTSPISAQEKNKWVSEGI